MNRVLEKKQLSADVFRMKIEAPLIAEGRKAGQFIILQVDEDYGERIPLTIANADQNQGFIEIIFQAVGATTLKLSRKTRGILSKRFWAPWGNQPGLKKKRVPLSVSAGE